jgi:hypothetical protein
MWEYFKSMGTRSNLRLPRTWFNPTNSNKEGLLNLIDGYRIASKYSIVCYKYTSSCGGNGVTVVTPEEVLPTVRLYSEYIPKKVEFRVHVNSQTNKYLILQKKLPSDIERTKERLNIRSHANGWIYSSEITPKYKELIKDVNLVTSARALLDRCKLDYGVVDVGVDASDRIFLIEINTAPGIEKEDTLNYYKDLFKALMKNEITEQASEEFEVPPPHIYREDPIPPVEYTLPEQRITLRGVGGITPPPTPIRIGNHLTYDEIFAQMYREGHGIVRDATPTPTIEIIGIDRTTNEINDV